jgi:hypothetical protein
MGKGTHWQCPCCALCMASCQKTRPTPSSHHGTGPRAPPEMYPCKVQFTFAQHLQDHNLAAHAQGDVGGLCKILEFEGTTIAGLLLRCRMLVEEDEISLRGLTATPPQCCHHRTAHPSPHGCPPPWLPSSTADAPAAMCPPRCSRQGHVSPTLLRPCCEQQMCTCLYALNLHPVTPFLLLHYRRYSVR